MHTRITDTKNTPAGIQPPQPLQQDHPQVTCNNTPTLSIQKAKPHQPEFHATATRLEKALQEILKHNRAKFKVWSWTSLPCYAVQPYSPHGAPQILFQGLWDNLSIQSPLSPPAFAQLSGLVSLLSSWVLVPRQYYSPQPHSLTQALHVRGDQEQRENRRWLQLPTMRSTGQNK